MSGCVPITFDAAVIATSRVRSLSCSLTASTDSSPVSGSKSTQRMVVPVRSAARSHGPTFELCSSVVRTTSSPGSQDFEIARDMSKAKAVALRPKITVSLSTFRKSASADRDCCTISAAFRSAWVTVPRFARGFSNAARMALPTAFGY